MLEHTRTPPRLDITTNIYFAVPEDKVRSALFAPQTLLYLREVNILSIYINSSNRVWRGGGGCVEC